MEEGREGGTVCVYVCTCMRVCACVSVCMSVSVCHVSEYLYVCTCLSRPEECIGFLRANCELYELCPLKC